MQNLCVTYSINENGKIRYLSRTYCLYGRYEKKREAAATTAVTANTARISQATADNTDISNLITKVNLIVTGLLADTTTTDYTATGYAAGSRTSA